MGESLVRRAFTLVELMMVIAIIGILVALLQPGFTLVTAAANQMRCATNLHRLWQAVSMRSADETAQASKKPLRATVWPSQVLPYLESGAQFMICPQGGESLSEGGAGGSSASDTFGDGAAGGQTSSGGGSDWPASYAQLSDLADAKTVAGGNTYITALDEGRWCLKLSDEQYAAAVAANLLNNSASADNIRDKFDVVYHPGANRHAYWLCFEDHGGDEDYKDFMIHVTEQKDGSFSLEITAGYTGHTNSLISKPEGVELLKMPSNSSGMHLTLKPADDPNPVAGGGGANATLYAPNEADDPVSNTVVSTSYAMNIYYPRMTGKGSKILLMDYTKYLAYVNDDWGDEKMDPGQTGVPIFARHGGRMNVLYADGSVVAEDPKDVNPVVPSVEAALWDP